MSANSSNNSNSRRNRTDTSPSHADAPVGVSRSEWERWNSLCFSIEWTARIIYSFHVVRFGRFLAGTVLWEFRLGVECALFDDGLGGQGRVVAGFGWIRSDLVGLTWTGVMEFWIDRTAM
jgi:hypothetical protein